MPDKRSQFARDIRKSKQLIKFIHYKVRDLLALNAAPACFVDHEATLAAFETARLHSEDKRPAVPIETDELPETTEVPSEPSTGYQPY